MGEERENKGEKKMRWIANILVRKKREPYCENEKLRKLIAKYEKEQRKLLRFRGGLGTTILTGAMFCWYEAKIQALKDVLKENGIR